MMIAVNMNMALGSEQMKRGEFQIGKRLNRPAVATIADRFTHDAQVCG
jgi:hypothetical protein